MEGTGMKIAMVSEHASPLAVIGGVDAGGQNVHVDALSRAMARQGHEVTVYTRRDDPDLPDRVEREGVVVEHVPAGPAQPLPKDELLCWMPDFGHYLAQRFEQDRPDVVHAHFWMSGLAALVARRATGVPVVQTFHALGVVKRRHQGAADTSPPERLRLEQAIARDVDHVVATCTDEVFELRRLGTDRRRISVVPCGVDIEHFTEEGEVWPPRGERKRLLSVGRLVERKGVDTVIRALRFLGDAELVVAGGPSSDKLSEDPEAKRLVELAERLGVRDRVIMTGRVDREQMPALMRSADIVVCMPWYEPFGIVPLEAMACRRPVVAAAVGGLVDTVADDITGMLVPPRRPDRLATALRRLLDDPFTLEAYGQAGIDRARSRYSWDRVAIETVHAYQGLLAQPVTTQSSAISDDLSEELVDELEGSLDAEVVDLRDSAAPKQIKAGRDEAQKAAKAPARTVARSGGAR
jgi:glycosyltransferase involved in cell wall biosynthesis